MGFEPTTSCVQGQTPAPVSNDGLTESRFFSRDAPVRNGGHRGVKAQSLAQFSVAGQVPPPSGEVWGPVARQCGPASRCYAQRHRRV